MGLIQLHNSRIEKKYEKLVRRIHNKYFGFIESIFLLTVSSELDSKVKL
jgi:hypothetical protein